jgi:hypothetical protein
MPDQDTPFTPGLGAAPDDSASSDSAGQLLDPDSGADTGPLQGSSATASAFGGLRADESSGEGEDTSDAVLRLLSIVEDLQRTATSSRDSGKGLAADIIARIERLESWVATNRNA